MQISVFAQKRDFEIPSTIIPTAWSLSAAIASGERLFALSPDVWSFGSRITIRRGISPVFSNSARSVRKTRSEEHTSELQSLRHLVCRPLLGKRRIGFFGIRRSDAGSAAVSSPLD